MTDKPAIEIAIVPAILEEQVEAWKRGAILAGQRAAIAEEALEKIRDILNEAAARKESVIAIADQSE